MTLPTTQSPRSAENPSLVRLTARQRRRERREQRELIRLLSTRPANMRDEVLEMASRVN